MTSRRVLIIGTNNPLEGVDYHRIRMTNADRRAKRHAPRFKHFDLCAMQEKVHRNILRLQLSVDGREMSMLDLMNYIRNGERHVTLTPENADRHLTLARMITLNGIFLYQYLAQAGFAPEIVQNWALADIDGILDEAPLAVCISSNFIYLDDVAAMAKRIKELAPGTHVTVGGMLVKKVLNAGEALTPQTLNWLSSFHGSVDSFIIEALGEQTLVQLLTAVENGGDPGGIANLAYFNGAGRLRFTRREAETTAMDTYAIAWDRIPAQYLRPSLPVSTSRGCAFRCRFCLYWQVLPRVEFKSVAALREELRRIQSLGFVTQVRFTDDNLTSNPRRLKDILQMMVAEQFDFTWTAFARATDLTADIVPLMRRSGCEHLYMGIESGAPQILKNMNKKARREQIIDGVKRLNDAGIYGEGGFIIGFPGETAETFADTIDLINTSGLPYYQPNMFYYSSDMPLAASGSDGNIEGLGVSWRHDTIDAAAASDLMAGMDRRLERACSDGMASVWETFRLLRSEGYTADAVFHLFSLKKRIKQLIDDAPAEGTAAAAELNAVWQDLKRHVKP